MKTSAYFTFLAVLLAWTTRLQAASTIQFATTAYMVAENAGSVSLTVQRAGDTNTVVTVDYVTADGSATNGLKYTAASGTLDFGAGETNKTLLVSILNEGFVEGTKWFRVGLTNTTGDAVLGARTTATVSITDNDVGLQLEFGSYSVAEGAGSVLIGVARGDDGSYPVRVDYFTTDSTAFNGVDYTGVTNTLFFAAGEKVQTFTVPILNDGLKESSKAFRVTLSNPTNQVLGAQKVATVTILDNDAGVQFQPLNRYWIAENEGALTLTVVRGNDGNLEPFTVDFATSNLTAMAGVDYTATNGIVAFAQGEMVKTLTVPILYDEVPEPDRQFKVALSNPTGGAGLGPYATATITVLDTTGMKPHRLDSVTVLPDRSVRLTLGGGVHTRFKDYFDLYPIEVSSNLIDWTSLITLQRTNSSNTAFTYTDTQAGTLSMRFYRTMANHSITPFRQPTGPFTVGKVSRLLTDPTRRNRYGISTNGSLMSSIWYPAVQEVGRVRSFFEAPQIARDPAVVEAFTDRMPYLVTHALADARCAASQSPYPIALFAHALGGGRSDVTETAANLASHGYVVVSVDHIDALATVYPDGSYFYGDASTLSNAGFQDQVRDLLFVLDELARWNDTDPVFAGRLDLTKVATMGMSWGGGVAGELGRIDGRIKAVVLRDAYLQNADDLVRFGLSKPFLGMYSTGVGGDTRLFNMATKDAAWFQISSTGHANFHDWYWWSYPSGVEAGREAARTINAYTLWFLDKYLKGLDVPMPTKAAYPRVTNLKQK